MGRCRLRMFALAMGCVGCGLGFGGPEKGPQPSGPTFVINASGVEPRSAKITAGTRVFFFNADSEVHQIASDPARTECAVLNGPELKQGEQFGPALNTAASCSFYDLLNPSEPRFRGAIDVIRAPGMPSP